MKLGTISSPAKIALPSSGAAIAITTTENLFPLGPYVPPTGIINILYIVIIISTNLYY
jgi:hypothetical protein